MEKIDDIVADIRAQNQGLPEDSYALSPYVHDLLRLADRIEAAHKCEIEDAIAATVVAAAKSAVEVYEPHIQSEPVGNAAKMREALVYLRDASRAFCHLILNSKYNAIYDKYKYPEVAKISDAIANAGLTLSAPARNCDVGTAGMQEARFHATGELYHTLTLRNALAWAQMPYEKGEEK